MLTLGQRIHWVLPRTAFMPANLVFIFSGATEGRGGVLILTVVVLFDFLEHPDELVRPEKTRREHAVLFKVHLFGEEILALKYFLRASSQLDCKKFHDLKKSGYIIVLIFFLISGSVVEVTASGFLTQSCYLAGLLGDSLA